VSELGIGDVHAIGYVVSLVALYVLWDGYVGHLITAAVVAGVVLAADWHGLHTVATILVVVAAIGLGILTRALMHKQVFVRRPVSVVAAILAAMILFPVWLGISVLSTG
jgi:hypothetical protein